MQTRPRSMQSHGRRKQVALSGDYGGLVLLWSTNECEAEDEPRWESRTKSCRSWEQGSLNPSLQPLGNQGYVAARGGMSALGVLQKDSFDGIKDRLGGRVSRGTRDQRHARFSEKSITRAEWGVNAGSLVTTFYNQPNLTFLQHLSSFLGRWTVWSTTSRMMLSSSSN